MLIIVQTIIMLIRSLPHENVQDLQISMLPNHASRDAFLETLLGDAGAGSSGLNRVRVTWHCAGGAAAADAIQVEGIRCSDDGRCARGRYGRGGYVASCAAKANAYAGSEGAGGQRHLFLVLALPEEELYKGERGQRASRTVADCPAHPTEYCFVDESRLLCVCRLDFHWVPTGRRPKVATAGNHAHAWRAERASSPQRSPRAY